MTDLPRELLGSPEPDPVTTPLPAPSHSCRRCRQVVESDDYSCPACERDALEERVKAAQESRTPASWSVVPNGTMPPWGAVPKGYATGGIISAHYIDRRLREFVRTSIENTLKGM